MEGLGSSSAFSFIESTHGGEILVKTGYRHYLKRMKKYSYSVSICSKKGFIKLNAAKNYITEERNMCPGLSELRLRSKLEI